MLTMGNECTREYLAIDWARKLTNEYIFERLSDLFVRLTTSADEFLDREVFYILPEVKVLIKRWWRPYNTVRPRSSLNCLP